MKIKTVEIIPLKMGRVKSTGAIRAIECKVSVFFEDGRVEHKHVNTRLEGIYKACLLVNEILSKNMKERGVA